jgi:hypothetical protein
MAARVPLFEGIDDASAVAAILSQLEDIRQVHPGRTTNEDLAFRKLKSELETNLLKLRDRSIATRLDPTGMITARGMHRAAQLNPPVAQIRPRPTQTINIAEISPPPTRSPSVVSDAESSTNKSSSQKGKSISVVSDIESSASKPSSQKGKLILTASGPDVELSLIAPVSSDEKAACQSSEIRDEENDIAKTSMTLAIRHGEEEIPQPESSTWAAARKTNKLAGINCTSCIEDIPATDVAHLPCGHDYCGPCILQLFNTSLVDETLFPPHCCKQLIPPAEFHTFLAPELIESYAKKKQELETADRTYCSDPACSIFMRPENIAGDCATCPECKKVTCTMCKAPAHKGDCPPDETLQKVLELAKEAGWQRCSSCKAMVSITMGCNCMRFVTLSPIPYI